MTIVMSMHWPEITQDHYNRVLKEVRWEKDHPKGALFHVAWFAPDGFRVTDVWRSAEDFQRFSEQRLTPVTTQMGLKTQPNVQIGPSEGLNAFGEEEDQATGFKGAQHQGAEANSFDATQSCALRSP